jgi:hypothetical protein
MYQSIFYLFLVGLVLFAQQIMAQETKLFSFNPELPAIQQNIELKSSLGFGNTQDRIIDSDSQVESEVQSFDFTYASIFPEHAPLSTYSVDAEGNAVSGWGGKWVEPFRKKPGIAFLGSLVIPGFSQAANEKWIRSAVYVVVEIAAFVAHQSYLDRGRAGERAYINFVNQNWSVLKYAEWLVGYHQALNPNGSGITMNQLLNSGTNYVPGQYNYGPGDWQFVNITALRELEQITKYDFNSASSNAFSHLLPDYGSQQYYELAAKYFQFGSGWRDYATSPEQVNWSLTAMSPMFLEGAEKSRVFNNQLRTASRITSLILLNHVASAFDGYVTVRLKNFEMSQNAQNSNRIVTGVSVGIPF